MAESFHILYVEDDLGLSYLVQQRLEQVGYTVDLASDGESGLAKCEARRYDAMAIDQEMPGLNGLQVVRILAARKQLPPTIMITGNGDEMLAVEALKLGASDYLVKDKDGAFLELLPTVISGLIQQQRLTAEKLQALEALRQSEEHYRTVFETTGNATVIVEADLLISQANSEFEALAGYSKDEIENHKYWTEFVRGDTEGKGLLSVWPAQTTPFSWGNEVRFVNRWNDIKFTLMTVSAIPGTQKHVISLLDITQRKAMEDQLRRRNSDLALLNFVGQEISATLNLEQVLFTLLDEARRLLGGHSALVWLVDADSEAWVCRYGAGPADTVLRGWRLASGEGAVSWAAQCGQSFVVSDTRTDERYSDVIAQRLGFELRSILCAPLKIKQRVVGVLQVLDTKVGCFDSADLALLKPLAASAAIAIENARLYEQAQQEIADRKRAEESLRQRTVELQERNEDLDAFSHTVAHDLKGVLTHIIGFADLLVEESTQMPFAQVQDYAALILQSGFRMHSITDELLLLAQVRKQDVKCVSLEMPALVDAALLRLDYLIKKHQAEIVLPDSWLPAMGYGPWIQEVWVNYVSNAVKYGGRPPRVELGSRVSSDGGVSFWVCDNGPGIAAEVKSCLFLPFTRLDQVRASGHGLGLSIVRRIVEKLNGEVAVESLVGQGSTFVFTLPALE